MTASKNFWNRLPRPFFILAPMEDVTDAPFRALIAQYGKPDVFFTEFTAADGLVLAPEDGKQRLLKKLEYGENEHPIVAQLFTSNPEHMEQAARIASELGFDGIDINMGCPDKAIEKQGCGSAMIQNPTLAKEIIRAAKRGAGGVPVSVKTRIGYRQNELDTWLPTLLEEEPALVTIHARTRAQMSKVPAQWETIAQAVKIRDALGSKTLIAGNGDVQDLEDARAKAAETGCDGVMLGRVIYGNPWLFRGLQEQRTASLQLDATTSAAAESVSSVAALAASRIASVPENFSHESKEELVVTPQERIEALAEHIRLFDEKLTGHTSFAVMKKHFKAYIHGWDHAKGLRMQLMETSSPQEALFLLKQAHGTL